MSVGREDYEARRQARIDRAQKMAAKATRESEAAASQSFDILRDIPAGQPILVGHHSEAHHRRDLNRADQAMRHAIDLDERAQYYEGKAKAAAENTAISSDDPQALEKLTAKAEGLRKELEQMKAVNKYYRKNGTCAGCAGVSDAQAAELEREFQYHPWAPVPYPDFELSNIRQRIKAAEVRIEHLRRVDAMPDCEILFTGGCIRVNSEVNRVQILFDEKPDAETRSRLKAHGFRWAPSEGAWQKNKTTQALRDAKNILGLDG